MSSAIRSQTATATAAGGDSDLDPEWMLLPLYLGSFDMLMTYDVIDCVRLSMPPGKVVIPQRKQGVSDKVQSFKDALAADPFSLRCINNLGSQYEKEAMYYECGSVLLRGWKRASEIKDAKARFRYLMKLSEVSHQLRQYRQAFAVLQDIQEPTASREEMIPYLILRCRVYSCNGDVQGALKTFQRAIETEDFAHAVRIWALVLVELRKAGAYEAAKKSMEKLAGDDPNAKRKLETLEGCCNQAKPVKKPLISQDNLPMLVMVGGIVSVLALVVYLLYLLESWSLAGMKPKKQIKLTKI